MGVGKKGVEEGREEGSILVMEGFEAGDRVWNWGEATRRNRGDRGRRRDAIISTRNVSVAALDDNMTDPLNCFNISTNQQITIPRILQDMR